MRTILAVIAAVLLGATLHAQTAAPVFVVVTVDFTWDFGVRSPAGEVERLIATQGDNYILWHPSGVRLYLPTQYARLITAEEAALRLIEQRQQLDAALSAAGVARPYPALTEYVADPPPPAATELFNHDRELTRDELDKIFSKVIVQASQSKTTQMKPLSELLGPAGAATAGAAYKVSTMGNTHTVADVEKLLTTHHVPASRARDIAPTIHELLRSRGGKSALLITAGIGGAIAFWSAVTEDTSKTQKDHTSVYIINP
jgi:hypothetical protein